MIQFKPKFLLKPFKPFFRNCRHPSGLVSLAQTKTDLIQMFGLSEEDLVNPIPLYGVDPAVDWRWFPVHAGLQAGP